MAKKKNKGNKQQPDANTIRTPIVCVLGHVDHGKTSLLDKIRGSSVVNKEAGAITQHIGATIVPLESIEEMSGTKGKVSFDVPGLLFIDTPGHHAFTTLRARGGALADMAILVVDINEGFQPQTIEALQILKNSKTPFVVAATKIDRIHGWRVNENAPFMKCYDAQNDRVKLEIETKTYEVVGKLSELGFNCERYDRIKDFQKNIGIVPVSGITGEGLPDLLMVMIGLAQRYMTENLKLTVEGPGTGTVIEVKEERGLGTTLDVILFDGTLKVGDEIVVGGNENVITTKVRSLLKPRPMQEILTEDRFERVKSVSAASGIKVSAPNLDDVVAGSPLIVVDNNRDELIERVKHEMQDIEVSLSEEGLFIKADTIGALEALSKELEQHKIPIMRAEVGPVSRHDIIEVGTIKNPLMSVLLAFNTTMLPDALDTLMESSMDHVKVFESSVIYHLIDDYIEWEEKKRREMEKQSFEKLVMPAKITLLPDCVFRQNNPAVVGIRVLGGKLQTGVNLIHLDGRKVGKVKQMKKGQDNIQEAIDGDEIAISIEGPTIGRQVNVGDDLYVDIPEHHVKVLETEMISHLNSSMTEILEELTRMKRKDKPFWGK
ncbi:translation initiation factor IF-2 [Methanoplanus sp. FWC-SCC4]|uniref:Probable translation initiation factor IF-2 n=1 Tax=Methanochimaera problematica TaxID=2609417 RepID=A0AA97FAR9_9EURY|nr:translation initiation factor IF-2 [Methanoplanus sp. FWC-SCC4]WOF15534.1 translation initiation factor IF-2 [Methanoplanus sp. FWC-SCC4]